MYFFMSRAAPCRILVDLGEEFGAKLKLESRPLVEWADPERWALCEYRQYAVEGIDVPSPAAYASLEIALHCQFERRP